MEGPRALPVGLHWLENKKAPEGAFHLDNSILKDPVTEL
jgi:hypothetical protein